MAAIAVLLLAGCHEGNRNGHSSQKNNEIQTAVSVDTSTLDEGLYEPSPKIEAFHPDSLMGSWQWLHTYGYLGNLSCKMTWCMVLRFERGNRLSVDFNGETLVDRAKYTLKKAEENPYGEYLITIPEAARKAVSEKVGNLPEAILNGYASFNTIDKGYEMKCLVITDTVGTGRKDLHQSSTFRRVDEAHPARPLRWRSEWDYENR
ncbi:MAG: hypothetical protein IJ622_12465 [Bacteroidales bacterium]|nr:hypothetical protein [Bacteroidales bacterium]